MTRPPKPREMREQRVTDEQARMARDKPGQIREPTLGMRVNVADLAAIRAWHEVAR